MSKYLFNNPKIINLFTACLFFLVISLISSEALSESQEPITEITVHASPLTESLKDIPASVTVIRPDSPFQSSNLEFHEIITSTPNFTYVGGSSSPRFLQIRGIGELEQYEGAPNPSVGLIYDDFDLSGLGLPNTLFDVEQIEVLRGPQATNFGANGLAGIVSIRSSEPTNYDSFKSKISLGNDNLHEVGVATSGAVFDSKDLSYRIALANQQSDGFRKNLYLNDSDTNSRERSDGIFQLKYQPIHSTRIDLETILARQNDGYDAFALNNAFTTQSDRPGEDDHDFSGFKLGVEHILDSHIKLKNTSSIGKSNLDYGFDGDWGNNEFWGVNAPYDYRSASSRDRDVFSEEFRVEKETKSAGKQLLGFFYQNSSEDSEIEEFQNEVRYDYLDSTYDSDTYAVFSAIEEPFTENTIFGVNFRAEYRDTEYTDSNLKNFNPDYNMQGGSVYAKYLLSKNSQIYSLASRGFKSGGFNAGTSIPDNFTEYQPETLWNYELGIKGSAISSKLNYNFNLFWMQRYDQQLKLALQLDPRDPLSFNYLTDNAATGRNLGMEGEIALFLNEKTDLKLVFGLLDTEIEDTSSELEYLQGREQSSAPTWNFDLAMRYLLTNYWYIKPSLSAEDSYYFDDSHDQKSDSYMLANLELGWEKDNFKIFLWGKNIANQDYAIRGFYFGNEPPDFPNKLYIQRGDPSSFGMTVSYQF